MEEAVLHRARLQTFSMDVQDIGAAPVIPLREKTFEEAFKTHFKKLYAYAFTIVKEEMAAEEMVQQVFFKIWEKKGQVEIRTSVTAYLYRSVYHESLNYLKHQKVKAAYQSHAARESKNQSDNASSKLQLSELEQKLNVALNELPEQCRVIFQMSRFEELKYQEIADRLGLSVKTIENQMGKALRILRTKLIDYLPLVIAFLTDRKP